MVWAKSTFVPRDADARALVRAGGDAPGVADEEGHPQGLLVHEALVEPSVVPEKESLVGAVHQQGVVEVAPVPEPVDHPSDVVVDRGHTTEVVLHVALVLPQRLLLVAEAIRRRLLEILLGEVLGYPHRGPPRR